MCTLNNTTNMKTFGFLIMWQGAYSLIGEMHNVEPSITEIYKKPGSYSNGSSWTDVGRFDNVTSNSRHSTLGVSRPLSSMTCSDAGVYSCDVGYINSSSIMVFHTGTIRKELKLQVTPSKITKRIFNASNDEGGIISELTNSTPIVHVGQKLRLQCTAITGTFNTSVQIVWMKRSLENGSNLAPFSSDKHIIGEPKAIGMCEFEKTDSIIYDVTKEDAERTPENSLHFQCYVHIMSIDWKTPEQQRRNFSFVVHSNDGNNDFQNDTNEINAYDSVDGNDENSGGLNTTTAKEFPVNRTVISGIIGGVCSLVILGAAGILLKRKITMGGCQKADEKSEETNRNPDAPVDTVPSARDSEIYTEIGETSDRQGNCRRTVESSFTVQTNDLLHYMEFGARVSEPYTELDNPIYENIHK
ncbi:uncharacterized protein LOC128235011 [Mya arenaria]|uniref:uncharacterized protein LOC128235011 n=1 Tax=Mya arenaria TaxID=6604 RepID=UPI0022E6F750|nr:uncharacterized protein LOC128235011 [Mya arenaria]